MSDMSEREVHSDMGLLMKAPIVRHNLALAIVTGSISRLAGGLYNSVRGSALSLHRAHTDISVIGYTDKFTVQDISSWSPIVPLAARQYGVSSIRYAPSISRALSQARFDVVHQHGIWQTTSVQVSAWRRRTGGKVMISPRGMLDPWALRHSRWKKKAVELLFERSNLRGASCLHALNRSEAQAFRSYGLANPIAIIPNGIDLPDHRAGDGLLPKIKSAAARRVLLFLGRLHPKKGISELIEAWSILRSDAPTVAASWQIVVAGWDDGGHELRLRELVTKRGLQNDVVFVGPLYGAAKDAALREADSFILPSYSEGLPMSVLEAWAYRLPVFMTDACNLPEGFAAAAAIRIETDPPALAAILSQALMRPDLADYGTSGRRLVEERYVWDEIARSHIQVYRWMLDGGQPPPCVEIER
ncbi:glycosyltransferase [Mesorhizobium sp. M0633]|uniref:glycosyltransferase n=1 Tax=Mesorhizobium sp. M0633 TaxID=2956977 RepID=UPI003334E904